MDTTISGQHTYPAPSVTPYPIKLEDQDTDERSPSIAHHGGPFPS
jgi:hypothetical protein